MRGASTQPREISQTSDGIELCVSLPDGIRCSRRMQQVLSVLILLLFGHQQQQQPIDHAEQLTVIVLLVEGSCASRCLSCSLPRVSRNPAPRALMAFSTPLRSFSRARVPRDSASLVQRSSQQEEGSGRDDVSGSSIASDSSSSSRSDSESNDSGSSSSIRSLPVLRLADFAVLPLALPLAFPFLPAPCDSEFSLVA